MLKDKIKKKLKKKEKKIELLEAGEIKKNIQLKKDL
jgi:hypothetical protein